MYKINGVDVCLDSRNNSSLMEEGGGTFLFLRKRNKLLNLTLFSSLIIASRFSLLVSES